MRLIDADALYDTFERTPWWDNADRDKAEDLLFDAPTVSPWVKTADRLPTEEDSDYNGEIFVFYMDDESKVIVRYWWEFVAKHPYLYPYWMPIPPLPEVSHDNS